RDHVGGAGVVAEAAGGRVVELRARRVHRVGARRVDLERIEAGVVLRRGAGRLVDHAVAVVVLPVAADLGVERGHGGVGVVAVVPAGAVEVRVAVAVDVARRVLAAVGGLVAGVDGARRLVVAVDGIAGDAALLVVAALDAVAVDVVLALGVVGREAAAAD